MKSTSARKRTDATRKPNEDKELTAWLRQQAGQLKRLKVTERRMKLDYLANAWGQARILLRAKKRLAKTPLRFKEWVEKDTDIGYSTALLWIDLLNFPQVKARLADSNPLELTIRRIRDAIRDERQAQGKGKPGSGKKRAAGAENNHPFEGENVPQVVTKNSLWRALRDRWALQKADPDFKPPQQSAEDFKEAHWCFQYVKNPDSTYATVAQATGKNEEEVKRLLRGLDIDRMDAERAEFGRQAADESAATPTTAAERQQDKTAQDVQLGEATHFHHGCKDFRIEDDRTLSLTNQHGDRVYIVSEKKGIDKLLGQAVSRYTGKGREK